MTAYGSVAGHRSMALDRVRNDAYLNAMRAVIHPDSIVLDVGAGTGIHGLLAARLGARRVYLVEPEDVIAVAEEIARTNGLQDRVVCIQGRIEDVTLPEQVDVIVSVLTGNFLLAEDLLGALFHARDVALKPEGVLIPDRAVMEIVPVAAPDLHHQEIEDWSRPQHGVDTSAARGYAANTVFFRSDGLRTAEWLAEPQVCHTIDFREGSYQPVDVEVIHDIRTGGWCHGWVGWFRMRLGDSWLSTSPKAPPLHWSHAFLPLDPPLQVREGERVTLALTRAPRGDWTWRASCESGSQQHSTVLSLPLRADTLRRAARTYVPVLNAEGNAVLYVLSQFDGRADVDAIARGLRERYGARFRTHPDALAFVQRLTRGLCG
jgi:SAM-dependent methyltransferase